MDSARTVGELASVSGAGTRGGKDETLDAGTEANNALEQKCQKIKNAFDPAWRSNSKKTRLASNHVGGIRKKMRTVSKTYQGIVHAGGMGRNQN